MGWSSGEGTGEHHALLGRQLRRHLLAQRGALLAEGLLGVAGRQRPRQPRGGPGPPDQRDREHPGGARQRDRLGRADQTGDPADQHEGHRRRGVEAGGGQTEHAASALPPGQDGDQGDDREHERLQDAGDEPQRPGDRGRRVDRGGEQRQAGQPRQRKHQLGLPLQGQPRQQQEADRRPGRDSGQQQPADQRALVVGPAQRDGLGGHQEHRRQPPEDHRPAPHRVAQQLADRGPQVGGHQPGGGAGDVGRGPRGHRGADEEVGDQEGQGVEPQREAGPHQGHRHAADDEADHLGRQLDGAAHPLGHDEPLAVRQHVGVQRRARGRERRGDRLRHQQDEQRHPHRDGRDRHQREDRHEQRAGEVAPQHEGAPRQPVGERAEHRHAEDPRDVRDGQRQRREHELVGALEDEQRDGDAGHLVAQVAGRLGQEQGAGLAHGEDDAHPRLPCRLGLLSCAHA